MSEASVENREVLKIKYLVSLLRGILFVILYIGDDSAKEEETMDKLIRVLSAKNWLQKIFDLLWSPQYKILIVFPTGKPRRKFGKSFEASFITSHRVLASDHWRINGLVKSGCEVYLLALSYSNPSIPDGAQWYFVVRLQENGCFGILVLPGGKSHKVTIAKQAVPRWRLWMRPARA